MPIPVTYTSETIAEIVDGKLIQKAADSEIKYILFDSRRIIDGSKGVFVAIRSDVGDGHSYINNVWEKGVRNFIVQEGPDLHKFQDASFIKVENSVIALQKLAAYHRRQFNIPVIGITGSNGKTTVKEWLFQLLKNEYSIVRSPKSYNSQIGVPLAVWQMDSYHSLGIFEAGISGGGEMERLQPVIDPTIGIITNILQAHDEGFKSRKEKTAEKLRLFEDVECLIYCEDYDEITQQVKVNNKKCFNWSLHNPDASVFISSVNRKSGITEFAVRHQNRQMECEIPFTDAGSLENVVHCICLMLHFGYNVDEIKIRVRELSHISMRLELIEGINNCTLINDSYNSDLKSLEIALDFLYQQKQHPSRTLILSDILQSGEHPDKLYQKVADQLKFKGVSRLIGIGEHIAANRTSFRDTGIDISFYRNTDEFLTNLENLKFEHQSVLIKGARKFRFEQIVKKLEKKVHTTCLEINLNAFSHNLNVYKSYLNKDTKIMVMVKAFSYGSGGHEIAGLLQYNNVDYLAVAYTDEGVDLRKAGIRLPILVMNPEIENFDSLVHYKLEPEIYNFRILRLFDEFLNSHYPKENYPVHLKLDTGMHRLGFMENDISEALSLIKHSGRFKVTSIFSHLAASDDPACDDFSKKQISMFERLSSGIISDLQYPVVRHILNSSGILKFPEARFEMVRLGVGLYGYDPIGIIQDKLEYVGRLKSVICQIKKIPAGDYIGYSCNTQVEKDTILGVVNLGYADGLSRSLGNGNYFMKVRGKEAPVIANICMDMCMIDLSGIEAEEGDEVIVVDNIQALKKMAERSGTIPYEILTGISSRVKRKYYFE